MTRPLLPALAVATLTVACADEGAVPRLEDEGDPCHTLVDTECRNDDTLVHCVDRRWTASSCVEQCRAQSPAAVGGTCTKDPYEIEHCECSYADPGACSPGELTCSADLSSLLECDTTQQWLTHPCAELCGGNRVSLGCREAQEAGVNEERPAACVCGQ